MTQRAAVTGAGSGIGNACAEELGRRGLEVVCIGRREDLLEQTVTAIWEAGGKAIAAPADIASEQGVRSVADQLEPRSLAALVHAAGRDSVTAFGDTSPRRARGGRRDQSERPIFSHTGSRREARARGGGRLHRVDRCARRPAEGRRVRRLKGRPAGPHPAAGRGACTRRPRQLRLSGCHLDPDARAVHLSLRRRNAKRGDAGRAASGRAPSPSRPSC